MEDKRFKVSIDQFKHSTMEQAVISTIVDTYTGVNYLKVATRNQNGNSNGICVIPLIDADGKPYVSEGVRDAYLKKKDAIHFVKENIEFLEKEDWEGLYKKYTGDKSVLIQVIKKADIDTSALEKLMQEEKEGKMWLFVNCWGEKNLKESEQAKMK